MNCNSPVNSLSISGLELGKCQYEILSYFLSFLPLCHIFLSALPLSSLPVPRSLPVPYMGRLPLDTAKKSVGAPRRATKRVQSECGRQLAMHSQMITHAL